MEEETGKTILILILAFFLGFYIGTEYNSPKAIEVYQGKTTLKYEIVDGVKIDSVVIYKDEK